MLIDGWVQIAAERLGENALPSCSKTIKDDILEGLSLLSDQLRHRLLKAADFDPAQLHRLLDFFPTGLHAAVLAAMTTREKVFQMPLTSVSCPALKALTSLPASPPSVLALHFDNEGVSPRKQNVGEEVWSCLKQALYHHSRLTSFLLSPSPSDAAMPQEYLLPDIAMLTSLRSLDLKGCKIYEDGSMMLRATLRELKQLQDLRLRLSEKQNTPSQKRSRHADAQPQHCLADMLSGATGLTSLYIRVHQLTSPEHQRCFSAAAPLHMPQLGQLTAVFDTNVQRALLRMLLRGHSARFRVDVDLAVRFFSNVTAPLTSLTLGQDGLHRPQPIPGDNAAGAGGLIRSLAAFTQLRRLSTVLPRDCDGQSSVCDALASALPGLIAALQQPQSMSISADSAVIQRIVPLLTATTLTKLALRDMDSHSASQEFFERVCLLKLRDLSLHFLRAPPPASGLSALRSLTQLTALCLRGWECLGRSTDWQALTAMTRLEALCLGGEDAYDTLKVPEGCAGSLHALTALTSLTVITSDGNADALVRSLAAQPLPALQELQLALHGPFDAVKALARYMAALPALTHLTVNLHRSADLELAPSWLDAESEDHPDNIAITDLHDAEECLSKAAAVAGVELLMPEFGF